jgi:hypothetical protein
MDAARIFRRHGRRLPAPLAVVQGLDLDEFEYVDDNELGEMLTERTIDETIQEIAEQTIYGEILLQDLIRQQFGLGIRVALTFLAILLGLPLFNFFLPNFAAIHVLGVPFSWLILSVLIYPVLWLLAAYFTAQSERHEEEFTKLVK